MGGTLCKNSEAVTGAQAEESNPVVAVHSIVFFDITIDGENVGRITMTLYDNTPKTSENFRSLCVGFENKRGETLTFKGCTFHRVIRGFMAQGGDFTNHNGTGGESIYGGDFADENFLNKHDGRGVLSMANSGPNTNGSQFFLCFRSKPNLNGKHCVFGKVTNGLDVLDAIERNRSDPCDKPIKPVVIADCGEISSDL